MQCNKNFRSYTWSVHDFIKLSFFLEIVDSQLAMFYIDSFYFHGCNFQLQIYLSMSFLWTPGA